MAVLKRRVERGLIDDARSRDNNQQRARLHQSKAAGVDQSCRHRHGNGSTRTKSVSKPRLPSRETEGSDLSSSSGESSELGVSVMAREVISAR
jgi:hypothetical protein